MKQARDHKYVRGRIEILDEILRASRKYTFVDLMEKLNSSLEFAGYPEISRKTLFNDLKFLKEEKGAPINKPTHSDPFYYYTEKFSIKNIVLDEDEIYLLRQASELLKKAAPFQISSEIDLIISKLDNRINTNVNSTIIEFESNNLLQGLEWIKNIFDAIICKQALKVTYQPFNKPDKSDIIFSPYLLKEYRNRWFVFGKNTYYNSVNVLALDRVKNIRNASNKYDEALIFDSEKYFSNLIGVSVPKDAEVQTVEIKVKAVLVPYIITKPLHRNQTVRKKYKNGDILIEMSVFINYELKSLILSHGSGLIVKKPLSLKQELLKEIDSIRNNYLV
jgi:predicted DNA-binding transcriptional regulator YafY